MCSAVLLDRMLPPVSMESWTAIKKVLPQCGGDSSSRLGPYPKAACPKCHIGCWLVRELFTLVNKLVQTNYILICNFALKKDHFTRLDSKRIHKSKYIDRTMKSFWPRTIKFNARTNTHQVNMFYQRLPKWVSLLTLSDLVIPTGITNFLIPRLL